MPRLKLKSKKHDLNPNVKDDTPEKELIFNRSATYKSYFENIKKIKKNNKDSFVDVLHNLENDNLTKLLKVDTEYNRKIIETEIDIIRRFLEEEKNNIDISNEKYDYYPDLLDKDFNESIFKKKEFHDNKVTVQNLIKKGKHIGFKRSTFQKFVKNFISPITPYNGLLLWHDVGVGKTCASIGIAENFRQHVFSNNKKIIILTPSNTLIDNWKNEIFNIEKEIEKQKTGQSQNVQCTGNFYSSLIGNIDSENVPKVKKLRDKIINQYYEFYGYLSLVNNVEKGFKFHTKMKKNIESAKIKYIKERFSNTVIIMDEIHVTRGEGDIDDKKSRPILEMICRYSNNTKIILCSATPMFNISEEIIWIINLLRWNDSKSPIEVNDVFEKKKGETVLTRKGDSILLEKTRGYISHVRGENPYFFPVKIPGENLSVIYPNFKIPDSKYDINGNEIPLEKKFKNFFCYFSNMSEWQYNQLFNCLIEGDNEIENISVDGIDPKPIKASNVIYPDIFSELDKNTDDFQGTIDRFSMYNLFHKLQRNGNLVESAILNQKLVDSKQKSMIFDKDYIGKYSCKFKSILNNILTSDGIVFIYSRFLEYGIVPISIMLEENGFLKLGKKTKGISNTKTDRWCVKHKKFFNQLTSIEKQDFKQATYIYIDGSTPKDELTNLVKEVNGFGNESNLNGEYVKVILGSEVIQQGISFKNVRQVHLLEPWYHLNQAKQASGRAIRNESHINLPDKKRNVIVFNHVSSVPISMMDLPTIGDRELIDEGLYRKAFLKSHFMGKINQILKKNSVDCGLNYLNNRYLEIDYPSESHKFLKKTIHDSFGNEHNVNLFDNNYSENCDFEICDYDCGYDISTEINEESDTYDQFFFYDDIVIVKEFVKSLFNKEITYVYHIDEILESVYQTYPNISNEIVFLGLDNLIKSKELFYDMYKRDGYLIERNNYYIFQPTDLEQHAPMSYRLINNLNYQQNLSINIFNKQSNKSIGKKKLKIIPKKKKITTENIESTLSKLQSLHRYIIRYVQINYSDYPEKYNSSNNIPSTELMANYLLTSIFERGFNEIIRINILLNIAYKMNLIDDISGISDVEQILFKYYYSEKKFSYFIKEKQLSEEYKINQDNRIIGLIFPTTYEGNKYKFFRVIPINIPPVVSDDKYPLLGSKAKLSNQKVVSYWLDISSRINDAKYNTIKIKNGIAYNNSKVDFESKLVQIYGTIGKLSGKKNLCCRNAEKCTNQIGCYAPRKFLLKYDSDFSLDKVITQSKKEALRGAVCGSGQNATKKDQLIHIVNLIYKMLGAKVVKYSTDEKSVHKDKGQRVPGLDINDKVIEDPMELEKMLKNNEIGKNLCEEIELLLRHRDNDEYFSDISDNNDQSVRYFFRFEETNYLKKNEALIRSDR